MNPRIIGSVLTVLALVTPRTPVEYSAVFDWPCPFPLLTAANSAA